MKWALVFLCLVRIITNAVWREFDNAAIYYIGQALFETGVLLVLYRSWEGWIQRFLIFCAFASGFVLLREVFFLFTDWLGNPTNVSILDRLSFWAGVVGLIYHELRLIWKKSKTSPKP